MRRWTVRAWRGLDVDEVDEPAPGPGQVRLRMRAASLNYRDLLMWRGHYDRRVLPYVPLSDGCGVVDALESVGSQTGATRAPCVIADCGQL